MQLVVDANVIMSCLFSWQGKTQDLLFLEKLELYSPEFIRTELDKYLPLMIERIGRAEEDIFLALAIILSKIRIMSITEYENFLAKASKLSPDPKDTEYFAVALALDCPLWSNDKLLKSQSKVKVLSTSELVQLFS